MSAVAAPAEYDFLANHVTVRVSGGQTDGRVAVLEMTAPPGDQPPLHVHHAEDEGFVLLEGELTLFQPGRETVLHPGEMVWAEHGIPHTYVVGDAPARWLVISSPAGFEAFTAEVARTDGMPSPDELTRIAARHDIEILGPPGARP